MEDSLIAEILTNPALWISLLVIGTIVLSSLERIVYKRLYPKLAASKHVWDESILHAIHIPLQIFIWLYGLSFCIEAIGYFIEYKTLSPVVRSIRGVGISLLFVWFLIRLVKEFEVRLTHLKKAKKMFDPTTVRAFSQIFRIIVILIAGLILLQTFGIPISGIVAFGGAGGLAAGLAAKDLLANLFGSMMIFLDRPFKIGDWISSPDKQIEGVVEQIGWRLTRVRKFDKRPLFIPNSTFTTISIENPSRMLNRRIRTVVGIRYEDSRNIKVILEDIQQMLLNHPEIDTTKACYVNLIGFGDFALNCEIYTFTKTTAWIPFQAIQQDVLIKVIEVIHKHGADIAYPTSTLKVPDGISIQN